MKNRKLVVSTGNQHKVEEIKEILGEFNIEVVSKNQVGLKDLEVIEDGKTLEENSLKKAKALAEKVDCMVIADDSGLFVDELGGEPGVYSSRYAGEEGNDLKNNRKLLKALEFIPMENRTAKFKTVIVLITEEKNIITVYGECKGKILTEASGENGFGYDPLFVPEGYDKTFAELGNEIKNKISHRANALMNLKEVLKNIVEEK